MFETLKKQMILDESRQVSEDALINICESYEYDNLLEETILAEDATDPAKPTSKMDDATLEQLIDELPEDDAISDEVLEEQAAWIDKFANSDSPNEYSSTDIDDEISEDLDIM